MGRSHDFNAGFHAGVRAAIKWLHAEAREMNDQHAQRLLDDAGFGMGCHFRDKYAVAPPEAPHASKSEDEQKQ